MTTTAPSDPSLFGKTLRPRREHTLSSRRTLHQYAQATLGSGDIRAAVRMPEGEDINEWLAMNCVDFYNEVSLLYGTIIEYCTEESCPVMSAGRKYEYRWADGEQYKSPVRVTAPRYVDLLMDWVERQLSDASIFPVSPDDPFPADFQERVRTIFKRLFRVYAHIYHSHFRQIISLGAEAHLNSCFKHFIAFLLEFMLVDKRELSPLRELVDSMFGPTAIADAERRHKLRRPTRISASGPASAPRPGGSHLETEGGDSRSDSGHAVAMAAAGRDEDVAAGADHHHHHHDHHHEEASDPTRHADQAERGESPEGGAPVGRRRGSDHADDRENGPDNSGGAEDRSGEGDPPGGGAGGGGGGGGDGGGAGGGSGDGGDGGGADEGGPAHDDARVAVVTGEGDAGAARPAAVAPSGTAETSGRPLAPPARGEDGEDGRQRRQAQPEQGESAGQEPALVVLARAESADPSTDPTEADEPTRPDAGATTAGSRAPASPRAVDAGDVVAEGLGEGAHASEQDPADGPPPAPTPIAPTAVAPAPVHAARPAAEGAPSRQLAASTTSVQGRQADARGPASEAHGPEPPAQAPPPKGCCVVM